jgi:hypothetical protein
MQRHDPEKHVECRLQGSTFTTTGDAMSPIKHHPSITRQNSRLLKQRSTTDLEQPDLTINGKTLRLAEGTRAQSL